MKKRPEDKLITNETFKTTVMSKWSLGNQAENAV
jgi:hypothetical protein